MSGTVGTAKKTSAWLQDFCYIFAHLSNVVTVKKYMIGNDQIKGANPWRNVVTVKSFERKTGIFSANGTPGVTEHTLGNIRKGMCMFPGSFDKFWVQRAPSPQPSSRIFIPS